ncbi:DUF6655 family protein [Planctomicrobium sp. SH661]|uniref:DUF6655 family protein n=1 Tax=Planctomicrobium sp. SH661 TaxID=3448124 RepID=UPI003F5B72B0
MTPNFAPTTGHRRLSRCGQGVIALLLVCGIACLQGCGTTKSNTATEQLLNSDAVDASVAKIDFTPLKGQLVYFDTKYMVNHKGVGFVTAEYVISSLRQQMMAAGLLLQEKPEDADYIVEGRIGTLGTDSHELVYGVPSSSLSAAATAASALSGVPAAPTIPEMSVARRNAQAGAAKIGVFAYDRESREAIWQSGISVARSTARDVWVFGVGPFQRGTIYNGKTRFAGESQDAPIASKREGFAGTIADYRDENIFQPPLRKSRGENSDEATGDGVHQAAGSQEGGVVPATHAAPASAAPVVPPSP